MIEADRLIQPVAAPEEEGVDRAIRPKLLADYKGQDHVKSQMEIFISAAKKRDEALDHLLIFGPPGLGKTTLAGVIAEEMNAKVHLTSGPILDKASDLSKNSMLFSRLALEYSEAISFNKLTLIVSLA